MKKMTCSTAPRSEPAALTFDAALMVAAPAPAPPMADRRPPPPAANAAAMKVRRFSCRTTLVGFWGVMARFSPWCGRWVVKHRQSLVPEMDEHPSEVVGVLLDTVVEGLDLLLVEKALHALFQLAAPFPGNDLDESDLLLHRFVDDRPECPVDVATPIVNIVQVECELHDGEVPLYALSAKGACSSAGVVNGACSLDADGEGEPTQRRVLRDRPDAVHGVRRNP